MKLWEQIFNSWSQCCCKKVFLNGLSDIIFSKDFYYFFMVYTLIGLTKLKSSTLLLVL